MTTFSLAPDDDARWCGLTGCYLPATHVTYPGPLFTCGGHVPPEGDR